MRLEGTCFADGQGIFPALGASLFWAVWGYKFDRPRLEENLRLLSEHDFDFIRCFAQVGPRYWEDRTIDPGWADYDAVLAGTIDLAYDSFGLRTELTLFGGTELTPTPGARRAFVDRVLNILQPRAHKVIFIEIANESFHDSIFGAEKIPELRELAEGAMQQSPNLVTISTPPPGEDGCALYKDSGISLGSIHFPRDTRGPAGMWGPVFAPRDYPYACMPAACVNNEPIGPGASVASEDDPARLVAAALMTYLAGMPAYVYHSHGGIWGGGERSRGQANLWEHPRVRETLKGLQRMKQVLPPGLMQWRARTTAPQVTLNPPGERTPGTDSFTVQSGAQCAFLAVGAWKAQCSQEGLLQVYALPEFNLVADRKVAASEVVELDGNTEESLACFGLFSGIAREKGLN